MALRDAFTGLRDALEDLGSLEVRSFTGDVTVFLSDEDGKSLRERINEAATGENSTLSLKLYTRLDADGDSDHFVAASGVDEAMATSHVAAFQMGQEIRRGYIELFRELADIIIDKPAGN